MRRWNPRRALSAVRARPILAGRPVAAAVSSHIRRITTAETADHEQYSFRSRDFRRPTVFARIKRPETRIDAWVALLDGALPPHLRDWNNDASPPSLSAVDVADILLEAHNPRVAGKESFDLLYHLGVHQGRWNAVVWLVKKLVEKFPVRHSRASRLAKINSIWTQTPGLEDVSVSPFDLSMPAASSPTTALSQRSLNDLTAGPAENHSTEEILAHDALGQVWRTLGAMTKACAGGDIRPEVLEIIAFLHHREVMPMTIYDSERHPDPSAIQQPPLLSLLSSRILTSLSDAAWRAHEKLVVEEAKAMGGEYADLRPEVPGAVYRVHVAGLRPEVWMELILWSCLRGGWLLPGADILQSITDDPNWKPLSWQDYEQTMPAEDRTPSATWTDWEYVFKTRRPETRDDPEISDTQIVRTVSAELVNGFIDALASTVRVEVGNRGIPIDDVIQRLSGLAKFLRQRGHRVTLSTGSWDGIILRLIESQGVVPDDDAQTIQQLVALSPGYGRGLTASNIEGLPAYVLDGNMAMHGLLNLAIRAQIRAGSFEGAVSIFDRLKTRIDRSRIRSVEDFMGKLKWRSAGRIPTNALASSGLFTSNFPGIEHPEFKLQIPTADLAGLLDLATDAKAYDFGRFLLHSDTIDEPFIGPNLYNDYRIQPAVIRFAAQTNDQALLAKFKEIGLTGEGFRAVLDTQIKDLKWEACKRVMEYLIETRERSWTVQSLATLMQTMLRQHSQLLAGRPEAKKDMDSASNLFLDMISGPYADNWRQRGKGARGVRVLAIVLSAIEPIWAKLCAGVLQDFGRIPQPFDLPVKHFNTVLEGVVEAYGTAAGKRLLDTFWPPRSRKARAAAARLRSFSDKKHMMAGARLAPSDEVDNQRIVVSTPRSGLQDEKVVIYGSLEPNTQTMMIILRYALNEIATRSRRLDQDSVDQPAVKEDDELLDIVTWAVRRLAERPYVATADVEEVSTALEDRGLHHIVSELPQIMRDIDEDLSSDTDESIDTNERDNSAAAELNKSPQSATMESGHADSTMRT